MQVAICDVGPRDGLRNEDLALEPAVRAELVNRLAATALDALHFNVPARASPSTPRWPPARGRRSPGSRQLVGGPGDGRFVKRARLGEQLTPKAVATGAVA
jgi:hypothetical protein